MVAKVKIAVDLDLQALGGVVELRLHVVRAERIAGSDTGSIHGAITGHDETWTFDLTPWSNYYDLPADLSDLAGQYNEEVAPFARNGMVLTIDNDGRAFFQSGPICA